MCGELFFFSVLNSVLWLLHLNDFAENNQRTFAKGLNLVQQALFFADFVPKDIHLNRIQSAGILYLNAHSYN